MRVVKNDVLGWALRLARSLTGAACELLDLCEVGREVALGIRWGFGPSVALRVKALDKFWDQANLL